MIPLKCELCFVFFFKFLKHNKKHNTSYTIIFFYFFCFKLKLLFIFTELQLYWVYKNNLCKYVTVD